MSLQELLFDHADPDEGGTVFHCAPGAFLITGGNYPLGLPYAGIAYCDHPFEHTAAKFSVKQDMKEARFNREDIDVERDLRISFDEMYGVRRNEFLSASDIVMLPQHEVETIRSELESRVFWSQQILQLQQEGLVYLDNVVMQL